MGTNASANAHERASGGKELAGPRFSTCARRVGGYYLINVAEQLGWANYLYAERLLQLQQVLVVADDVTSVGCQRTGKVGIVLWITAALLSQRSWFKYFRLGANSSQLGLRIQSRHFFLQPFRDYGFIFGKNGLRGAQGDPPLGRELQAKPRRPAPPNTCKNYIRVKDDRDHRRPLRNTF
jgi:hypothetical protein